MQIRSVGIDLGKTTFHLVALGDNGKVLLKKKFTQKQLITFTANLQTSLIGLEACSGAHFLGRALRAQGHDVKLIPGSVRKALCEVEQERLHRCRGDCRSSRSSQHALRPDQDRRSAGPASAAPGARSADVTKNFCDQPDSRFPAGARHGVCEEPHPA